MAIDAKGRWQYRLELELLIKASGWTRDKAIVRVKTIGDAYAELQTAALWDSGAHNEYFDFMFRVFGFTRVDAGHELDRARPGYSRYR